jgi:hypothetical protein
MDVVAVVVALGHPLDSACGLKKKVFYLVITPEDRFEPFAVMANLVRIHSRDWLAVQEKPSGEQYVISGRLQLRAHV